MRSKALIAGLVIAVGLVVPALAEEIIYFKNGTTLPIRSHNVVDGMIHVDLGSDALMAFPADRVEKIVAAGQNVYLDPSSRRANVSAPGHGGDVQVDTSAPNNSYPVRATAPARRSVANGTVVSGNKQPQDTAWQVGGARRTNQFGLATEYPASQSPNAAARRMGVVGRRSLMYSQPGDNGAVQIGNKQGLVVNSRSRVPQGRKPEIMRFQPTGGLPAPQTDQRPPAQASPADAGGSAGGQGSTGGSD